MNNIILQHIFIQARINSKRFPNKILKKICNKSILELIVEKAKKIKNIDKIILVTGVQSKNQLLLEEAQRLNLEFYCGNEDNILDRFYKASKKFNSETIVRLTGDNPLIDFNLINNGLEIFQSKKYDILSIDRIRTYPLGMNFQIFTNNALEDAWNTLNREINNNQIFETMFIPPIKYMLEKKKFKHFDLTNKSDFSKLRFTLDHSEDFKFIKKIYESLYHKNKYFDLNDILLLLEKNPNLLNINKNRLNQDKNVLLIEK